MSEREYAPALAEAQESIRRGDPAAAAVQLGALTAGGCDDADVWHALAVARRQTGDAAGALDGFRRALALQPEHGPALLGMGQLLGAHGQFDAAFAHLSRAHRALKGDQRVDMAAARVFLRQGAASRAVQVARALTQWHRDDPEVWRLLGDALRANAKPEAALLAFWNVQRLRPDSVVAQNDYGLALQYAGRLNEAARAFRAAARLDPGVTEPVVNLIDVLRSAGQLSQARRLLGVLIRRHPDDPNVVLAAAIDRLTEHPDHLAWQAYEARTEVASQDPTRPGLPSAETRWRGAARGARTALILAEQGFGDVILFARFLDGVRRRFRHTVVLVPAPLLRLFQMQPGLKDVRALPASPDAYPPHDVWNLIGSLPLVLRRGLDGIAVNGAYLRVDAEPVEHWRARLAELAGQRAGLPRVGVVWAGAPRQLRDAVRSIGLKRFAPILDQAGCVFVNLQPAHPVPENRPDIVDLAAELDDFATTAAVLSNLDLVITVDSVIANLAAALGRPTWVLLDAGPDWRWGWQGEGTLWYRSVRLFRQARSGDWDPVTAQVADALGEWLAARDAD